MKILMIEVANPKRQNTRPIIKKATFSTLRAARIPKTNDN
jgi:hypothetical protein